MAVTDDRVLAGRDLVASCASAVRGGATTVQLRLKRATPRELAEVARGLLAILPVPLFVNDRLDVALAVGAAGAHLGPDDLPGAIARRVAPPGFILGASVGSEPEATPSGWADYWGVGPLRGTGTKGDAGEPIGIEGFAAIERLSDGRPCIAIGGVRPEDGAEVVRRGGAGVAVVSGIFVGDPEANARAYAAALHEADSG